MKIKNKPDGSYTVSTNGRTVLLTIKGVVDMEFALRLMLEIKIVVTENGFEHWATLVDLCEWGLHPPEIVEFIHEFNQWAEKNGQIAEAAVVDKSVLKYIAREKLVSKFRKKIHQEYFEKKTEAIEWLQHMSLFNEE